MKKYFVFFMFLSFVPCLAQRKVGDKLRLGLNDFRKTISGDFESFRKQVYSEFAEYVRNPWDEFIEEAPVPVPKEFIVPPVVMPEEEQNERQKNAPIRIDEIVKPISIPSQPTPLEPIKEVPVENVKYEVFSFLGTSLKVRFDKSDCIHLKNLDENGIADALEQFNAVAYDNLLLDCLSIRDSLQLSDWAYIQMLKSLTDKVTDGNDATLTLAYLYMQSGYKMRLAKDNNKLYMLFASQHYIYDKNFYLLDGVSYYGLETLPQRLQVCLASYPKEKSLSLLISTSQKFSLEASKSRKIVSKRYSDIAINIQVNKNLMRFYDTYPTSILDENIMTRWAMYANTPMDNYVKGQLYSQLESKLAGLSQLDAANRLLNWVQTGFAYEYDDKVWGHDRAFFSEESLFYPYCDCEDRSILFTRLVRDLLRLQCILVYYPGHLASAIEFTDADVKGDYIMCDGHKYIIADGTYINAPIGETMPGMDNVVAKVILLK